MIEEDDDARARDEGRNQQKQFRQFVLNFMVWPSVGAIVLGIFMNTFGLSDGSGWPGTLFIMLGALMGIISAIVMAIVPAGSPGIQRIHKGGSRVRKLTKPQAEDGVPIGMTRMPETKEPLHLLIEGSTGTGKTQILKTMLDYIRARGDTVVVVDTGYDLHKTFGRPDDIVLSCFDEASPGWMPANEIRSAADWSALAQSFIGDGVGEAQQWHQMAKALFATVGRKYAQIAQDAGEPFDHHEFFHLLTQADAEALAPFVAGSAAASLGVNDKALNNVRMTYFSTLKFWEYLRPGDFSLRDWIEQEASERRSIFIPYTKRQLPEAKNLISCWLDQIINGACDGGENRDTRAWIIIDELSGLGEIPALKTAVTELRKTGFRVVCGIQNFEQVEDLYGKNGAVTITTNLSNKVILRATDANSAERQSKLIGDARFQVQKMGSSAGSDGKSSTTRSVSEEVSRLVLASEITALPDLTAFVKFAGEETAFHTSIPVYQAADALIEAVEAPQALPAPSDPTPAQIELQAALEAAEPITPANAGGDGPQTWTQVDKLLKQIGGEGFDGERFRAETLERLGWVKGQTHEKFAMAHERARQLLIKTLDRNKIEEQSQQENDSK